MSSKPPNQSKPYQLSDSVEFYYKKFAHKYSIPNVLASLADATLPKVWDIFSSTLSTHLFPVSLLFVFSFIRPSTEFEQHT